MPGKTLCDVFIVDSDSKTRSELKLIATSCGYSAMVFPDGHTALGELRRTRPRLAIIELLLPGLDGFELCQEIRSDLDLRELPLLCTSAISWGSVDLEELLTRRFNARFLPKGSLAQAFVRSLNDILGAPTLEKVPELQPELPPVAKKMDEQEMEELELGKEEVLRAQDLTREFEERIAAVSTGPARRDVRVQAEYQVSFKNLDELATEYTQNISRGGLFIYAESSPPIDDVIGLTIKIPELANPIDVKARVVHSVSAEQAKEGKIKPGFGVQFLNLTEDDRALMEKLVEEVDSRRPEVKEPEPAEVINIVMLGVPVLPFVGRPNFLLRDSVRVAEFQDLPAAEKHLSGRQVDLVIVGEGAFVKTDALGCMKKLDSLISKETKRIIMLDEMRDLTDVLVEGLCHMVLDKTLTMESLLNEVSKHLSIKKRTSMRVPYRARVAVRALKEEFTAVMVNISCGGMLLITKADLKLGTTLRLGFSLTGGLLLTGRGEVVRKRQEDEEDKFSYGVKFSELDGDAEVEIKKFVQKHVNFREYFRWMKKRYFEWP